MSLRTIQLPAKCPNIYCSNHIGEGTFALVVKEGSKANGFKPISLLMCAPCAQTMVTEPSETPREISHG